MMTRSSSSSFSGRINVAASTQRIDVDNRISLRFYFRIADNILKQADIFRAERNIIDLYIMLLRFSSLVSETIPRHRDYKASLQSDKNYLKKRLLNSVIELEELKPAVQRKIEELSRKHSQLALEGASYQQRSSFETSTEWTPIKKQHSNSYSSIKKPPTIAQEFVYQAPRSQHVLIGKPAENKLQLLSLNIPRPKEETLSRHSILGPNGLRGQWQPPSNIKGVRYPNNIDITPVEIPRENSLRQPVENVPLTEKDDGSSIVEKLISESAVLPTNDNQIHQIQEPDSLISFEAEDIIVQTEIIRQPSPPPVLADVQDLIPSTSPSAGETHCGMDSSSPEEVVCSEAPLQLHISTSLMDSFMKLAKSNTKKNLETCGVLAGLLKNRKFYITALIIPKQESTSDSCQTTNEEEIFEVQDKRSLFPLGWIHTHPTQSCFMSSIDVHTHYSYQIMLPEAIAIVMAPTDTVRKHGIFRLTTPGGMSVIRQCPRRGFHAHDPPADGGPIYKQCTDVYMNPDLKFDVIDLR